LSTPEPLRAELDNHVSSDAYIDDTTSLRQEVNEALSLAARRFPPAIPGEYTEAEYKVVSEYLRTTNAALFERYRNAFDDSLAEMVSDGQVLLEGELYRINPDADVAALLGQSCDDDSEHA
jgi:hypothetical protein